MAKLTYSEIVGGAQTNFDKVGKVSTESVFKHTHKHWKEWVAILERAGAQRWTYQEIAAYLKKKHKLTPWWQQGVALGFEIATGRRRVGQDAKGHYMVTATKSLPCKVTKVWKFLVADEGLAVWMQPLSPVKVQTGVPFETTDGFFGEIRTLKKERRIRMYWQDPAWGKRTVVEIMLVPRPEGKSILVFNHTGLRDPATREQLRKRWKAAVEAIATELG